MLADAKVLIVIEPTHLFTSAQMTVSVEKSEKKHKLIFNNWMIFNQRAKVWNHSPFVTVTLHLGE